MIDEENLPPDLEELKEDDDIDLEASISQLVDEPEADNSTEPAKTEVETPNSTATTGAASDTNKDREKIDQLLTEIVTLKRQVEERNSQYTRLYADFDNFRKRTQREKEEEEDRINGKILKKFLAVIDDFERAQSQIKPKTDAEANIHTSYQSVYKQLVKCLKESGVVRMRAVGQEFDPNYHEAIAQEPTNEFDEGVVMDELRPGYLLGERVLRHALVKVAAAKDDNGAKTEETGNSEDPSAAAENTANTSETSA